MKRGETMQGKVALPGIMKADPNPTASIAISPKDRRLFCSHYSSCLDIAVEKKWQGFSCNNCKAFAPTSWNAEDRMEDEFKCMALIFTILFPTRYAHLNPGRIVGRLEREARWQQEFGGVLIW
jgi:hypothetical protein